MCVDDQRKWQRACAATFEGYDRLSADARAGLDGLIAGIMQFKQELFELALAAGGSDICRTCGGQCCLHGKYHVTALDLLAYRSAGVDPPIPDFGTRPLCPYGGETGCTMAARFRSVTCLIFNCELLEERWGTYHNLRFSEVERNLRSTVAKAEELLGYRASRPLLLSLEQ